MDTVCIFSPDIAGPNLNGGIGTHMTALATLLSSRGKSVRLISTIGKFSHPQSKSWEYWVDWFGDRNILLDATFDTEYSFTYNQFPAVWQSYETMLYLQEKQKMCDIVHFPEWNGAGYFSLLAKRQGTDFHHLKMVVQCHSSTFWAITGNNRMPTVDEFKTIHMEQESIRLADVLVTTPYLDRWHMQNDFVHRRGIVLGELCSKCQHSSVKSFYNINLKNVCFFGRLNRRKGIDLFLNAIRASCAFKNVYLIGKRDPQYFESFEVNSECSNIEVHDNLSTEDALAFMQDTGCLVVLPYVEDNYPISLIEVALSNFSYVTTNAGGIPDMIEGNCMLKPDANTFAKFFKRISTSTIPMCKLKLDRKSNEKKWVEFHDKLSSTSYEQLPRSGNIAVEVVMTTFEPSELLLQAVKSIQKQTFTGTLSILIVDDHSSNNTILNTLDCPRFPCRSIVTPQNSYLGAARNFALLHLLDDTNYILFMDDDNVAKDNEIEILVKSAIHTNADIYTVLLDEWTSRDFPSEKKSIQHRWLPLACGHTMTIANDLGDANMFIKRSILKQLNFTENRLMYEDWELLTSAILQGFRVELVPYALFWKRNLPERGMMNTIKNTFPSHMRVIEPFKKLGWSVYSTALLAADSVEKHPTIIDNIKKFRVMGEDNIEAEYAECRQKNWQQLPMKGLLPNGRQVHKLTQELDYPFVGRLSMHPWLDAKTCSLVSWTYKVNRNVHMTVNVRASISRSKGDGVILYIQYGTAIVFSKRLHPTHHKNRTLYTSLPLKSEIGKALRIYVHPNNSPFYDEVYFHVSIAQA